MHLGFTYRGQGFSGKYAELASKEQENNFEENFFQQGILDAETSA